MKIPEEMVIAGKGPSLDVVDWNTLPEFRVGVNEAALSVPNCAVAIALDNQVWDVLREHAPNKMQFWVSENVKFV